MAELACDCLHAELQTAAAAALVTRHQRKDGECEKKEAGRQEGRTEPDPGITTAEFAL